jgi:hypothetical protein
VPFTFPSHPGLILPLWVRRPERYDAVALSVGSVIPDLVDHPIGYLMGRPDFKLVHGLAGLVVVGIPLGLLIVAAVDPLCQRLSACPAVASSPRAAAWLDRLTAKPFRWKRSLASVAVGGFSHLVFDAPSHWRFEWLAPWIRIDLPSVLPPVFSRPWLRVPLPGFERPWGIWPFDLVWLTLTVLGAGLFVWSCRKGRGRSTWR